MSASSSLTHVAFNNAPNLPMPNTMLPVASWNSKLNYVGDSGGEEHLQGAAYGRGYGQHHGQSWHASPLLQGKILFLTALDDLINHIQLDLSSFRSFWDRGNEGWPVTLS